MTAEHNDNNIQATPVIGPGERLRAARLAAGLDKGRVAAQLHLRTDQIDELERDHFDGFAARVFVRGYLRNFARLVGLSPDDILAAFDEACPDPDEPALKRVGSHKPQVSSRHGFVRFISWLLILGIAGLFGVWWAGYLELNGNGLSKTPASAPTETVESQPAPLAPGALPLPSVPQEEASSGAVPKPVGVTEPVAEATPEPAPTTAPVEPAVVAPAPGAPEAEPVAEQAEEAPIEPSVVAEDGRVVLTLAGPCWVEVRATDGSFKLLGTFDAGTRKVLGGNPPYRILLGNATVATLTVDGQDFDLAPHTRQQVARFELDPAAL